jgi:hypothetical protein
LEDRISPEKGETAMPKLVNENPLALSRRMANRMAYLAEEMGLYPMTLLLIGDGSGSVYSEPAGWYCTAFDVVRHLVYVHARAVTGGTNHFAELMAFIQALYFHHSQQRKERRKQKRLVPGNHLVHLLTDSEVTVRCGQGVYSRQANGFLWDALAWFEKNGYTLTWHHVRRGSNEWQGFAAALAEEARELVSDLTPRVIEELKRQF